MARKELEISITPTGEVKVLVKCVPGASCVEETKFLEEALGGEIKDREFTSDYYQQGNAAGRYTTTGNS